MRATPLKYFGLLIRALQVIWELVEPGSSLGVAISAVFKFVLGRLRDANHVSVSKS